MEVAEYPEKADANERKELYELLRGRPAHRRTELPSIDDLSVLLADIDFKCGSIELYVSKLNKDRLIVLLDGQESRKKALYARFERYSPDKIYSRFPREVRGF
ncbi:MAG TPA: hypothetical protein VEF35_09260 [Candidatus Bathyarchaeia archaeon]|nr:hypothetical protein [Candidatus Bathyarchaeia archaeon]